MWYSIGKHTQCLVSLLEPPRCLHVLENIDSCHEIHGAIQTIPANSAVVPVSFNAILVSNLDQH
eukprot:7777125-Prorocentrum_lima.AAC.1